MTRGNHEDPIATIKENAEHYLWSVGGQDLPPTLKDLILIPESSAEDCVSRDGRLVETILVFNEESVCKLYAARLPGCREVLTAIDEEHYHALRVSAYDSCKFLGDSEFSESPEIGQQMLQAIYDEMFEMMQRHEGERIPSSAMRGSQGRRVVVGIPLEQVPVDSSQDPYGQAQYISRHREEEGLSASESDNPGSSVTSLQNVHQVSKGASSNRGVS